MAAITHVQSGNCTLNSFSTTASGTTVTAGGTSFQTGAANVGVTLTVSGAGPSGADYSSTIASITDATHAVMNVAATSAQTAVLGWQGQAQGAGQNTTSPGLIVPNAINAGDLLCAAIHWDPADTTTVTISDTSGNVWQAGFATIANADYNLRAFYCLSAKAAAAGTNKISFGISAAPSNNGELSLFFSEFSGPGVWVFDGAATGNSTGTNCVTSTGLTTSQPNSVFWSVSGVNSHVTAVGSGFTDDMTLQQAVFTDTPDKEPLGDISQYKINTALQSNQTVAVTQNATGIFLIGAMAFSNVPMPPSVTSALPPQPVRMMAAMQEAVTSLPPQPERTSILWSAVYPDRLDPPLRLAHYDDIAQPPPPVAALFKHFYVLDQLASSSAHGSLQDGGTPPSVATTATGWRPGTGAAANTYSEMKYANDQGFGTFGATALPSGAPATTDCWRTQNPLTGTFSAGTWTFGMGFIGQSSNAVVSGNLRVRIWRSSDPTGQTAITELTTSTVSFTTVTNLTSSAQQNTTASAALPAATLTGEYLFLECAWLVDTVSGATTSGLWFRQDGSNSFILSPVFTAASFLETYTSYPDYLPAMALRTGLQQAFALAPLPVTSTPPSSSWEPVFQDRVSPASGLMAAAQQAFAAPTTLERPAPLADVKYPDILLPAAGLGAALQEFASARQPNPSVPGPIFVQWLSNYPDKIDRPGNYMTYAGIRANALFALSDPFFPNFPDVLPRPSTSADLAMAWTGPVQPVAASSVPTQFPVSFPDSVFRPTEHPALQAFATGLPPRPERTSPMAASIFPDLLNAAAALRTSLQMAPTATDVFPERTSPLASESHADFVQRPFFGAAWQMVSPVPPPAPERTAPLVSVVYADAVPRPAFPAPWQMATTTEAPQPERTSDIAAVSYPDWLARADMPVALRLAVTTVSPRPERTTPIADAHWPDRLPVAGPHASLQEAPAAQPPVIILNPSAPLGVGALWPDWLPVRVMLTADQQATALAPSPLPDIPLRWQPHFEDFARGVTFSVRLQQAAAEPLAPERTAPIASASYPDWLARAALPTAAQQFETTLSPLPIGTALPPLTWLPSFPDWLARASVPVVEQMAASAAGPQPERTTPLAAASFPDWLARAMYPASEQSFTTSLSPLPIATQVPALSWASAFPDWLGRPAYLVADQTFATSISPLPIAAPLPPHAWSSAFPDRIDGVFAHPSRAQFAAIGGPATLLTPLGVSAQWPDAIARPMQHASIQQFESMWPTPLPNIVPIQFAPCFPDILPRPFPAATYAPEYIGVIEIIVTPAGLIVARTVALTGVLGSTHT